MPYYYCTHTSEFYSVVLVCDRTTTISYSKAILKFQLVLVFFSLRLFRNFSCFFLMDYKNFSSGN